MKKERTKHFRVFLKYACMGEKRSLRALAKETSVPLSNLQRWSKAFNWQDRVKRFDKRCAEVLEERLITDIKQQRLAYRKLIKKSINAMGPETQPPRNVTELEKLIKLDLLLMGDHLKKQEQAQPQLLTYAMLHEMARKE